MNSIERTYPTDPAQQSNSTHTSDPAQPTGTIKLALRSLADALAVYPILLLLMGYADLELPAAGWVGFAWLGAAAGRALPALLRRKFPASLAHLALIAATAAAAGMSNPRLLWLVLPVGVLSWGARRDWARTVRASTAVGLHAFVLAAASPLGIAAGAKPLLLAAGIGWLAAALYFLQARSLAEAGLYAGLVTRRLAVAGKRYLALWGLVVALVFLPFAGVPIWPQVARFIRWLIALAPAGEPAPESVPEPEAPPRPPIIPQQDQGPNRLWIWLEYAVYVALALLALAVVYFLARRYLLNAVWWRRISERVKAWYDKLLGGKRAGEADLGYTEERESLLQGEKLLARLFSRRRPKAKRALRLDEWSALPPEERVRSLYAAALADAVGEGYAHEESRTPTETIRAIEEWQGKDEAPKARADRPAAGGWLARKSGQLGELYGRARYGGRVKSEEADRLGADYPWRK
ncbi:hypothetical protein [Cohnella sp. JJ-181]|uniref:hypothetical protein n=1 Tax=Cohnella rhizoplanae TaxID=2974897 RepID=UPI0022FFB8D6|nr:hypothetical protein [Cohnella sp. JJ-181]CAI6086964.1 hypothetical protein COHCIP112018_05261 [Cohnella sp. JJ-181]